MPEEESLDQSYPFFQGGGFVQLFLQLPAFGVENSFQVDALISHFRQRKTEKGAGTLWVEPNEDHPRFSMGGDIDVRVGQAAQHAPWLAHQGIGQHVHKGILVMKHQLNMLGGDDPFRHGYFFPARLHETIILHETSQETAGTNNLKLHGTRDEPAKYVISLLPRKCNTICFLEYDYFPIARV